MRLTVVGSGYVGLVTAACFADMGHEIVCVDNDARKVALLQRGEVPIHEQHLPELLAHHRGVAITFSRIGSISSPGIGSISILRFLADARNSLSFIVAMNDLRSAASSFGG